jgi:hypothetical protein
VIYDEIKKRHENFVMDQRISCSARNWRRKKGERRVEGGRSSISPSYAPFLASPL